MITLTEKEYRVLLAQCACAFAPAVQQAGYSTAIESASSIILRCGITCEVSGPATSAGVEPSKCCICHDYLWPHEKTNSVARDGVFGIAHQHCLQLNWPSQAPHQTP